tara:strand:- start:122 stop:898 length:777 start_codon:yes stop_codon:yes gene_type:complete
LFCDGSQISSVPVNAKLFFSSSCTGFLGASKETAIDVYYTGTNLIKPTINIGGNLVVNFHVLQLPIKIAGGASFKCTGGSSCTFNVTGATCTSLQPTAISFVPYPQTALNMDVSTESVDLNVPAECECGLTMSSVSINTNRYTAINGKFGSITNSNSSSSFYAVAAGNVGGSLHFTETNKNVSVIILSSEYAAVTTDSNSTKVVDVGKLMSVFGTFYEIEFYHNGREFNDTSVIPAVNRYLAIILLFCKSLAFANGLK